MAHLYHHYLPSKIKTKRGLLEFNSALKRVHFPDGKDKVVDLSDMVSVYESKPHRTVAYSEFFLTEIGLAIKKRDISSLKEYLFLQMEN